MFIATIENITALSWRQALIVDETQVPRENYRLKASHLHFFHIRFYRVHLHMRGNRTLNFSDYIYCLIGWFQSNNHRITESTFTIIFFNVLWLK